jgi:hypothetical protein
MFDKDDKDAANWTSNTGNNHNVKDTKKNETKDKDFVINSLK